MKGEPASNPSDPEEPFSLDASPDSKERGTMREAAVEERGASTLSQARSLQSRLGNLLAIGLIGSLTVGLVGWYYAKIVARPSRECSVRSR